MLAADLINQAKAKARGPIDQWQALQAHKSELAPPAPGGSAIGGHFDDMRRDSLGCLLSWRESAGDVARARFIALTAHLLSHPDDIRHVLIDNNKNYDKKTRGFEAIRIILGNGLLTSEGDFWRRQRRIAQPAFHRERIAGFANAMCRLSEESANELERDEKRGEPVDMLAAMMKLTLRIAGATLLSAEVSDDARVVGGAVTELMDLFNTRLRRPFQIPLALPIPAHQRAKKAFADLDDVVYRTIAERRRGQRGDQPDLLTMLMEARDEETGETMSDKQLRDEVMTMFLAGHETTANALAWTLYLLSRHPAQRRQVEEEIDNALEGARPTLDHLSKLTYTKHVISESMRLYPPAWMTARRAIDEDWVGKERYYIPRNSLIFVSPYVTQRHPALWTNPEGFDPSRWEGDAVKKLPKHAYFPFGAGPRLCIGQSFALMEMPLVLAALMSRFQFDLAPGARIEPEPSVTLRPKHGVPMFVRRR